MKTLKTALIGIAASILMISGAAAQSLPFSFGGGSSFARGPDRLTFGFATALCDDCRTVPGGGGPEDIIIGNSLGLLLAATWIAGGASASSSAPALAYSLGVEHDTNSVNAFRQAGGAVFPTSGDSTFTGVFVGVAYETPLGGGFSSSSIAVPTFGLGLNLGYGWAAVDGFGGAFQTDGSGLYGRADAYMAIPLAGGMFLSPGISYRVFDFNGIEDNSLMAFLRFTIPL
ncbi:hypothetical protein [Nioella nitratireducens]|uniref:hypothetical protein n=1 Tax=Nioella nitratireducens TaxID=1287720 RepID=UPI0008FD18BF|nr:hypothetical protein [Nioella nitratireducens]